MNNIEIWKPVVGYEGYYEVSNLGNVRALERMVCDGTIRPAKDVTKRKDNYGYYHVGLNKNGKETTRRIHRLVATAFMPNPDNKPFLDHINTIRTDNRVENLRWVTPKENYHNNLSKSKIRYTNNLFLFLGRVKERSKAVLVYDLNGDFIKEWACVRYITENTSQSNNRPIYACANGEIRHCRDKIYRWKEGGKIPLKIETGLSEREIEIITERWRDKTPICTDGTLF